MKYIERHEKKGGGGQRTEDERAHNGEDGSRHQAAAAAAAVVVVIAIIINQIRNFKRDLKNAIENKSLSSLERLLANGFWSNIRSRERGSTVAQNE